MVQFDTIWYNLVQSGTIWVQFGTIWYNLVQFGTIWYNLAQFATIWYNLAAEIREDLKRWCRAGGQGAAQARLSKVQKWDPGSRQNYFGSKMALKRLGCRKNYFFATPQAF